MIQILLLGKLAWKTLWLREICLHHCIIVRNHAARGNGWPRVVDMSSCFSTRRNLQYMEPSSGCMEEKILMEVSFSFYPQISRHVLGRIKCFAPSWQGIWTPTEIKIDVLAGRVLFSRLLTGTVSVCINIYNIHTVYTDPDTEESMQSKNYINDSIAVPQRNK